MNERALRTPFDDATASARLRRLDALFAERVLGCKVDCSSATPYCDCADPGKHGGDNDGLRLAHYTRSLDAAWEGATHLRGELFTYEIGMTWMDGSVRSMIRFPRDGVHHHADASHPAEALVLACLRAVGVGESDLA